MSYYIRRSVLTVIWLVVALLLVMSLISYSANDPSWSHLSSASTEVSNLAGQGGAWLADILYAFLGAASWWLIVIACYEAWCVWRHHTQPHGLIRTLGYVLLLLATAALTGVLAFGWLLQGMIGQIVGSGLSQLLTYWGTLLFLMAFIGITLTFTFNIDWRALVSGRVLKPVRDAARADEAAKYQGADHPVTSAQTRGTDAATQMPLPTPSTDSSPHVSAHTDEASIEVAASLSMINPLDEFLDETGFSEIKEYEWLAKNDAANPFKPVSSTYVANTKLTKKLDAKLQREVIKTPAAAPSPRATSNAAAMPVVPPAPNQTATDSIATTQLDDTIHHGITTEQPLVPADVHDMPLKSFESHVAPNTQATVTSSTAPDISSATPTDTAITAVKPLSHELTPSAASPSTTSLDDEAAAPVSVAQLLGMRQVPDAIQAANSEPAPPNLPDPTTPIHSRAVESELLDALETSQATDACANPLDITNDALFAGKSRAMQTAAYRANLTPLPELSLLDLPDPNRKPSYSREQLQQLSELLEIKLQEFNIKADVVNAQMGPVVTRFEVALAPGIKASKVTGIAKDLARSLSMASVRVVEVIPGKPYIGIEVPNPQRQMVRLIELLKTEAYQDPEGLISMAMGKDIAGRPIIADLAKAPHMLVAGTTGSGKSVLVNSLLLSMLLKYTPKQLRLILIDPKQLELANYNDIPHLLTPVVTDMTQAASSLSWSVAEMERRYQLMSLFKVRKLDEFNKKVIAAEQNGQPLLDPLWRLNDSVSQDKPPKLTPLPQIVIVADEFADMIMQVGKQAEELITRLAQKSRAAGIHLILATQRPSVDVITGLIKANIPVRAALRVNSKVDSRTILDAGGAEDMLGHGDMLFLGPGQIEPNRVHGAFISDAEVNRICDAWRERGAPDYIDNMFDNFELSSPSSGSGDSGASASGDEDPLYDEVVAFVLETRKVSASSIQRKFSIGYNRAARIVDAMEEAGLVSGMTKSGKRELLM